MLVKNMSFPWNRVNIIRIPNPSLPSHTMNLRNKRINIPSLIKVMLYRHMYEYNDSIMNSIDNNILR